MFVPTQRNLVRRAMFVHESQLRHVLAPEAYFSPEQHRREIESLFVPSWHVVAAFPQFRRDGDFRTLTLFDRPLLLRRIDGEVHAYLNVCGHRHCQLTSKTCGHDEHFRCQYHGWEYQKDGRTGKIPDAQSFRPFDRENARLHKFRSARCGDLVFVSLSDQGPTLEEFLGPCFAPLAAVFAPPWLRIWRSEAEYRANWKVVVENSLESYHIPYLHRMTFGTYPPESNVVHELHPGWTSYRTTERGAFNRLAMRSTTWCLGQRFTGDYVHRHFHPNLIFVQMDTFAMAQLILPTSPTTSHVLAWLYSPYGPRRNPLAWINARGNAIVAAVIARRVMAEDGPIFADVQQGLEASEGRGVIGRREERIHVFQDWVARHVRGAGGPWLSSSWSQG